MKYARIVYTDLNRSSTEYTNVGDWIQTFAVDELYKQMGIKKQDIIEINRDELALYKGEKCIVIMQGWFNQLNRKDFFPLSDYLIPVYIGFHRLEKKHLEQLKGKAIGCRDEATYRLFVNGNWNAYLSGCLTITFPRRLKTQHQTEIFFVDVPESLYEFVPSEIMKKSHKLTHELFDRENPEKDAKSILELYRDRAALVVTSRLHCAAPCMAMGIPVILTRNYFDDRYGWIDKYLKLYTPDKFKDIDWEVKDIDLETQKQLLCDIFRGQLFGEDVREKCLQITHFYINRDKCQLKASLLAKIYWKVCHYSPRLANFLRMRVLKRYTVIGKEIENQ